MTQQATVSVSSIKPDSRTVVLAIDRARLSVRGQDGPADFTLDVCDGEFLSLLGSAGSGKTALLRAIAGFEKLEHGDITLDGESLLPMPPYKRPINLVFECNALFPHMTIHSNVAYGLHQEGKLSRSQINDRAIQMLKLLQIEALAPQKPHELSQSQQQRVALARALIKQPRLVLFDDPLCCHDDSFRGETKSLLRSIQRRLGLTVLMATQHQEAAMTLSDRVAVVGEGRVLQEGDPDLLYREPLDLYVAQSVGTLNLLSGTLRMKRQVTVDGLSLQRAEIDLHPFGRVTVPVSAHAPLSAMIIGKPVWVGLRPEHIGWSRSGCSGVPWKVVDVAIGAGATTVRVQLENDETLIVAVADGAQGEKPPEPGDVGVAMVKQDAGMLFAR